MPDPLRERQLSHYVELERLRRATTRASDLDVRSSVAQPLPSHLSELERLRRVPSHPSDLEVRAVTVTDSNGHKTPTGETLFISAQLSTDAVSTLRKVWVLIKLPALVLEEGAGKRCSECGTQAVNMRRIRPGVKRKRKKVKKEVPSQLKGLWFYLFWRKQRDQL